MEITRQESIMQITIRDRQFGSILWQGTDRDEFERAVRAFQEAGTDITWTTRQGPSAETVAKVRRRAGYSTTT